MPETSTGKLLASGTFSNTSTALYFPPNNTTTRITHIHICTTTAATVNLSIEDVSVTPTPITAKLLSGYVIEANSIFELFDLIIEAGDIIHGHTPSNIDCDYLIFGIETQTP